MKRYLCSITIILIVMIMGLYKCGIAFFKYKGPNEGRFIATVYKVGTETQYTKAYFVKNKMGNFILYINKNSSQFSIGDELKFDAEFNKPSAQRNEGGFNYELYLKTKKIYGTFKATKAEKIGHNNSIFYWWKYIVNNIHTEIITELERNLKKENSALLSGLLIGDVTEISKETITKFQKANLTHVLAISGSNFMYIILLLNIITKKTKRKRIGQITTIICIIFFMELTGNSASVFRAGVMSILLIIANICHRKYDFWSALAFTTIIQILYNPYCIFDMGLILSYGGTIGLVLFYNKLQKIVKIKLISATISANLLIIPILMYCFNTLSFTFIISNIFTSIIIEAVTILGVITILFKFKILFLIINIVLDVLNYIVGICAKLPFSYVYVTTPSITSILLYYFMLFTIYNYKKHNKIKQKIALIILIIIISNINIQVLKISVTNELIINFVDVGQGDCTLIRKNNKTILIDGGGSTDSNYDVGKNILLPYLLNKKINKIDYIIISHFDTDHVGRTINCDRNIKSKKYYNF